jgi:dTDP-4-amino-4,6-dideoxygalactose transaminase
MTSEFLPFSKPIINQETVDEVIDCLRSGWLATGPKVKIFEANLSTYLKAPHALVLTSATAGLELTLKSFGLQPGDEVITSPMTFVASLNTIVQNGAKPVLVDVDLKTRNIDANQIEAALTSHTKAIMPIHFAGIPADMDTINGIATKHGLRVIEDSAHAIGSTYKDRIIGSFGDTQVFSFHPNKVMTSGEGGCITTRDAALAKNVSVWRFHGIDREAWNRNSKDGSQHYDVIQPGRKYNMMDLQAAIGIHQLAALENFIAMRKTLAERYNALFAGWPELTLQQMPDYKIRNSWYIYAPLINKASAGIDRDTFMQKMQAYNIGTGYHYQAAHLFTFYQKEFGYKRGQFPNAELISDSIVSLPLFPTMTLDEQDRVVKTMQLIFKES